MAIVYIARVVLLVLATSSLFNWSIISDYSPGRDVALSLCIFNDKLYVFGFDEIDDVPSIRAEVRDARTGALVRVWRGGVGTLYDCTTSEGRVYAVGTINISDNDFGWIVIEFDENLNVVSINITNPLDGIDIATAIYSDGTYIYISGIISNASFNGYRIEKRLSEGLELEAIYTVNVSLSWRWSYALPKIVESPDGSLWLLYLYIDPEDIERPRIEVFDRDLNHIKTIDLNNILGYPYTMLPTSSGHIYIGGSMGIIKIDDKGRVLNEKKLDGYIVFRFTPIDGNRIAAFSSKIIAPPYITMNSLLIFNDDLDIVANITISANSPWILWSGKMGLGEDSLYVAASEYMLVNPRPSNEMWAIYSLNRTLISSLQIQKPVRTVYTIYIILITTILAVTASLAIFKIRYRSSGRS